MKRSLSTGKDRVSPPPIRRKVQSTTTNVAVSTFFTPASQKPADKTTWHVVDKTLLVARYSKDDASKAHEPISTPRKVAAFDLDSTLICTASGNQHGRDQRDWKWWHPTVPGEIKGLDQKGYTVVVMSNQGGINLQPDSKSAKSDSRRLTNFKDKVAAVLGQLDMPITVYAATGQDQYRKPRPGMWKQMQIDYDLCSSEALDLGQSFFVGDAGGRLATKGSKNDHANSDRNLAANVGIAFHTPEEFFLDDSPRTYVQGFDPSDYLAKTASIRVERRNPLDVVLFCGSPGAGKSRYYKNHLQPLGYERVNQDTLKTRDRCIQTASECLSRGQSVAVDNTNAEPEVRAKWVAVARKYGVPIRCLYFTAPPDLCRHNNAVRALNAGAMNPENRAMLPSVAFTSFASRFRPPKIEEGFQDILPIDFVFEGDDEERKVWSRYWI